MAPKSDGGSKKRWLQKSDGFKKAMDPKKVMDPKNCSPFYIIVLYKIHKIWCREKKRWIQKSAGSKKSNGSKKRWFQKSNDSKKAMAPKKRWFKKAMAPKKWWLQKRDDSKNSMAFLEPSLFGDYHFLEPSLFDTVAFFWSRCSFWAIAFLSSHFFWDLGSIWFFWQEIDLIWDRSDFFRRRSIWFKIDLNFCQEIDLI